MPGIRKYVVMVFNPETRQLERREFLNRGEAVKARVDERVRRNAANAQAKAARQAERDAKMKTDREARYAEEAAAAEAQAERHKGKPCLYCDGTGTHLGYLRRKARIERDRRRNPRNKGRRRTDHRGFALPDGACCATWPLPCACARPAPRPDAAVCLGCTGSSDIRQGCPVHEPWVRLQAAAGNTEHPPEKTLTENEKA